MDRLCRAATNRLRVCGWKWGMIRHSTPCGWGPPDLGKLSMRPCFSYREHHTPKLSSWSGISTTRMFPGKEIQLSRRTRRITFRSTCETSQSRIITGAGACGMDKLIREMRTEGSLGCSDHALAEFLISRNTWLAENKVRTLNFRRVNF